MTPKVIILSGVPGCGKSTWATNYQSLNSWNTKIVSRDVIRENAFVQPYIYTKQNEDMVTKVFNIELQEYLSKKLDIVIDNTNCKDFWINGLLKFISQNSSEYNVYIKFFDVPLLLAMWRVWQRKRKTGKVVPFSVVRAMHKSLKKMNRSQFKATIL